AACCRRPLAGAPHRKSAMLPRRAPVRPGLTSRMRAASEWAHRRRRHGFKHLFMFERRLHILFLGPVVPAIVTRLILLDCLRHNDPPARPRLAPDRTSPSQIVLVEQEQYKMGNRAYQVLYDRLRTI